MTQLYHPAIYDASRHVQSYWEATAGPEVEGWSTLKGEETCDVAVIGGGYTGLSAAYHLVRDHGVDVRVLEAGPPAWGASGRNGGFCGPAGAKMGIATMIAQFGIDEARRYYRTGREAVDLVRQIGAEEGIDFDAQGDGEFAVAHTARAAKGLPEYARALTDLMGVPCEALSREAFAERGYRGPECFGAMYQPVGFGLHPMKLARGLARAGIARGAKVHGFSKVERWERDGPWHRLVAKGGSVRAKRVLIATNGFTEDKLHPGVAGTMLPAISNIITTRPLTEAERAAHGWATDNPIWDNRHLFFYFRMLKDGRFLIGARGNTTARPEDETIMREKLTQDVARMWPGWRDVEISHAWRGFVCLSRTLAPNVGSLADDPSVFHALAYHGSGVAWANWSGRAAARLIAGNAPAREVVPAVIAQPLRKFPLPALRVWYLRGAYFKYGLQDRLEKD